MKALLIFLLITTAIYAKSDNSCYSLEIKKLSKSRQFSFTAENYPDSCGYFSFKYSNSIRCGCFETKEQLFVNSKDMLIKYPSSRLVTTYKYRFDSLKKVSHKIDKKLEKKSQNKEKNREKIEKKPPQILKKRPKTIAPARPQALEVVDESSILDDLTFQGHIDLTAQAYLLRPKSKHPLNLTLSALLEAQYAKDNFKIKTKIKAQQDYYDFQGTSDHTDRSYLRLDELYMSYDFEDDQVSFGKNVLFWGALEVRNITDTFNSDELRDDPFNSDKLGSWNLSYTHYTDNGEFSAIVKFYESSRDISAFPYVYYYFPQSVSPIPGMILPLQYVNRLQTEESKYRPSIYLKYAASTDTEYPLDYAVIFENGYDSQRYYTTAMAVDAQSMKTNENAYLVNKLSTFNTLVVGSTLLKLEAVYTDVINDEKISDYMHLGVGVEYTLSQFYSDADLGLISEYYYYDAFDSSKRDDLELFELFQNDLFVGLRYSFNQGNDASLIGGAIIDMQYDEQVYYVEYETRLAELFKINFDYRFIQPSQEYKTAFHLMGRHERLSLKIGYYF